MKRSCALALILLALLRSTPAWGFWTQDGAAICRVPGYQGDIQIISDSAGGAFFGWRDDRDGMGDIYVQRVDADGVALWKSNGVPVCTALDYQVGPRIVSDGSGGIVIAWVDLRSGVADIYAQRIDASGSVLWESDGVPVCTADQMQSLHQMISDGAGGAIIVWEDSRDEHPYSDIYAQRIDETGSTMWTSDGVPICTANNSQENLQVASDGSGGAIIVWSDNRSGGPHIYAQRARANGSVMWTVDGVGVCTNGIAQYVPQLVSDGLGGAVIAWENYRMLNYHMIYAQRLTANGSAMWQANGVDICTGGVTQNNPRLIGDDSGGVMVTWEDHRGGVLEGDIYAQRVSATGVPMWTTAGAAVCTATGDQYYPQIVSDGGGGAIITWDDHYYEGTGDIYVQRIAANGSAMWVPDGVALCTASDDQFYPEITSDLSGGAILAWYDMRNVENAEDIYAQRVERNGYWGYPAPVSAGVSDVPGDQGGFVRIIWDASRLDVIPDNAILKYTVWRAMIPAREAGSFVWELMDSVYADGSVQYTDTVATHFDSTGADPAYSYFQIIAHGYDPASYWVSPPDTGYSVDNLAPAIPSGLAGRQIYIPEGLELTWDCNIETDFSHYAVYRGIDPDFVPSPSNLIDFPSDTVLFDGEWRWNSGCYYKLSAFDVHDNEIGFALLSPEGVTGAEAPETPQATYLAQNFPNPFNPVTRIRFGLKERAMVSLRIYDAVGRLVRVLGEGDRPAGRYTELWDGCDASGRSVASGVYFYRLDAGTFTQTRKMILLH